jgi:glucosamine-6-phosphate deaminase
MRKFQINKHLELLIVADYEELSLEAAKIVASLVEQKPNAILGLATGSSPVGMYQNLTSWHLMGEISFKGVTTYNLDEYFPIDPSNPQSYHTFMEEHFFSQIDILPENTHLPNGSAKNSDLESAFYEEKIRTIGGVDLQVLGIGSNGHIGFNEPAAYFEPHTHKVVLDEQTLADNARFFDSMDEMPKEAITMGIGTIMSAKHVLLLASGIKKAPILKEVLKGKVTPLVPASILQFHHKVTFVIDELAASELFPL